jgi:uncharacterized protein (TIGR03067 family)
MNRLLLLVPVAFLGVGAGAGEDPAKKELKKFEGAWMMVTGKHDGAKLPDEHVKKGRLTYMGKAVLVETPHQSKETIKARITRLDPTKKPAEMDWVRSNGPHAGEKMLAIYEFIDDDQYQICFAPAGKPRPKDFSTKAGSGHFLHVWKRVKK